MASKRQLRKRACEGKKRYDNWHSAMRGVNAMAIYGHTHMNAYRCSLCAHYHVGHIPRSKGRRKQ